MQIFQVKFSVCTSHDGSLVATKRGGASGCRYSRSSLACVQAMMVHWLQQKGVEPVDADIPGQV